VEAELKPVAPVEVVVEVARGAHIKRGAAGQVDYVSPLGCPFNYGSLTRGLSADGEPPDALVLGPALARGARLRCTVVGRVRFVDDGQPDDKLVCLPPGRTAPLSRLELARIRLFFTVYARVKAAWHQVRGARGPTRFEGLQSVPASPQA